MWIPMNPMKMRMRDWVWEFDKIIYNVLDVDEI